jgi:hypothetical protein
MKHETVDSAQDQSSKTPVADMPCLGCVPNYMLSCHGMFPACDAVESIKTHTIQDPNRRLCSPGGAADLTTNMEKCPSRHCLPLHALVWLPTLARCGEGSWTQWRSNGCGSNGMFYGFDKTNGVSVG